MDTANLTLDSKNGVNFNIIMKFGLILITILFIFLHFILETSMGQNSTWGNAIAYLQFGSLTISSVNLFYSLIIISIIVFLFVVYLELTTNPEFKIFGLNRKKFALIALIIYFLGIMSYFNFALFEPFILVYLCILANLYKFLVTNPISFAYEPDYQGFNILYGNTFTPWNANTLRFEYYIFNNQTYDFYILFIILLLFAYVVFYLKTDGKIISHESQEKLSNVNTLKLTLDGNNINHKKILLIYLLIQQYGLLFLIFYNSMFTIFYILLTISFPIFYTKLLKIPIKSISKYEIRFDFYFLYLINVAIITILLTILKVTNLGFTIFKSPLPTFLSISGGLSPTFALFILLIVAVILITKNRPYAEREDLSNISYNFTIFTFFNLFLFYVLLLYIMNWFNSGPYEGFLLEIIYYLVLIRLAPSFFRVLSSPGIIKFSVRRILLIIPMFIGVSIITYLLISLTGNPIDILLQGGCRNATDVAACRAGLIRTLEARYGLNTSILAQWFNWIMHFLLGDAGLSIFQAPSVTNTMLARIGPTLEISLIPSILSLFIAVPLGIVAANHQNSFVDNFILIFVDIGVAVPIFVLLILMILILTGFLQILPNVGRSLVGGLDRASQTNLAYAHWYINGFPIIFNFSINGTTIVDINLGTLNLASIIDWSKWDWLFHAMLPIVVITVLGLAFFTRLVRNDMLDTMKQDFILSARASGFSENVIIRKYALRNVLIPVVTFFGLSIGTVLAGAPITESVLSWPGLGLYALNGVTSTDYAVIMATTMVIALMILFANMFTDILYSVIDPRIRIE